VVRGHSDTTLQPGDALPGESVQGVLGMADEIGDEARQTMERIRALMADTAVTSVHASIIELEEVLSDLSEITEGQKAELSSLSASLGRSADRVEELAMREELDRSLARADSTLERLQSASGSLAEASTSLAVILDRVERGEGTLGRLSGDETLYESLDTALEEIAELARDLRENPGRYINLRIF
jgi:phospholipid/cholesterol/gamma-HCH transport system substrate-binding protein